MGRPYTFRPLHQRLNPKDEAHDIERSRLECDAYFASKLETELFAERSEYPKGVQFVMNPYTERIHRRMKKPKLVPMSRYARELANHKTKHTPSITHIEGVSE